MHRSLLFLVASLLLMYSPLYSQAVSAKESRAPSGNINNRFPFNTSATILLISFTAVDDGVDPGIINPDGTIVPKIVKKKDERFRDTLGHKEVREIVRLSGKGIKDLSGVLNKLVCSGPINSHACYSPRNAVLFIDKDGSVAAELEVCFECLGFKTRPQELYINDIRACMYEALKKIFTDAGVQYGIKPNLIQNN